MPSPSEKHFLYHLIISQLYHDGFGPHATLLEEAALQTNRAIAPSDRLKRMLSACAHTVREVDQDFERRNEDSHKEQQKSNPVMIGERPPMRSSTPSPYHTLARRRLTAAKRHSVLSSSRGKHLRPNSRSLLSSQKGTNLSHLTSNSAPPQLQSEKPVQTSQPEVFLSTNSGPTPSIHTTISQSTGLQGLTAASLQSLHGLSSVSQGLSSAPSGLGNPSSGIQGLGTQSSTLHGLNSANLQNLSSASALQQSLSSASALQQSLSSASALQQGISSTTALQQSLSSTSPSLQGLSSALSVSIDSGMPSMAPNTSVLQNLFGPSDGNLFSTAHKDQSAEAVRVLQNIFQKRDILPMVQSDMSHDLNSLIQASTDVITSSPLPTPTVSISASTSSEPTSDPKPKQETPSEEEDAMIEEPPPIPGPPTLSAIQNMVFMDGPVDMEGDLDGSMKSSNTSPTSGPSLGNNIYGEEFKSEMSGSPTVKEEIQDHDEDEVHYPSNSQDIINQLNSLSATGMSNTNLQNLANSLSSGLSEHQENHLNTLTNLSLNLSESLASSLNLANPGLDSTAGPSSSNLNQTFSGMTPSKLELYNRLECGDKPSMLSMVNAQRPPGAAPGTGPQDWGATGDEKYYQCPYCPKVYTTTQSLHRHKHSHTGTNMKACPLCGKTSYRVDNLKSHIRNCYKKRLRMENLGGSDCSLES